MEASSHRCLKSVKERRKSNSVYLKDVWSKSLQHDGKIRGETRRLKRKKYNFWRGDSVDGLRPG